MITTAKEKGRDVCFHPQQGDGGGRAFRPPFEAVNGTDRARIKVFLRGPERIRRPSPQKFDHVFADCNKNIPKEKL